jgi:hypothetical protein
MKLALLISAAACVFVAVGCSGGGSAGDDLNAGAGAGADEPATAEDESELRSAKVTLRVPLLDYDGKPLSKHNAALAAAGLGTFPESVEIEGGATGAHYANATKKWDAASALIDKANEQLNLEIEMRQLGEPYEYKTSNPATSICYKGNPKLVVNLISSLTDNVFSDQLSIHGWRYRQTKVTDLAPEDEASFPSIWKNWRGQGAAILMITASSDGGEEMNVGLISKCQ